VFGASDALDAEHAAVLLRSVDDYLSQWSAHGFPLSCAREWRDGRFLVVGVDQSTAGASGCSIDALFRTLHALERSLGTSMVAGGRVFYRDSAGAVQCVDRATYAARVRDGAVHGETPVFDTTLTSAADYRSHFERAAASSWHAQLT
jgi:hypothetical protein